MSWASGRRFLIVSILVAIVASIFAFIGFATLYKAPSCADNSQNQGEAGIDCGGPCASLCSFQVSDPVVRFTRTLFPSPNRTDIIAYVDNPNASAAARNVPYTVTLYAANHSAVKTESGIVDLPPFSTVPIFLPSFYVGDNSGMQATLVINPNEVSWITAPQHTLPEIGSPEISGTTDAPRITATLTNPTSIAFSNVKVVVAVFDSLGNIIAASETIVPHIGGQAPATATFTWNTPFASTPARIEVTPVFPVSL